MRARTNSRQLSRPGKSRRPMENDKPSIPVEPLDYASPVAPQRRSVRFWLLCGMGTIVAVWFLTVILIPPRLGSHATSNRVRCASNLRQIGQAILLYTNDFH